MFFFILTKNIEIFIYIVQNIVMIKFSFCTLFITNLI